MRGGRLCSPASRGGQLAEVWFLPEDQAAFDAFFTEAGTPVLSEPAAPGLRYRD
jgi:hypothetical protein